MIIDFHTHIFPDKIASRTVEYMEHSVRSAAYTDGTLSDLKRSMRESGVTHSVVLPVATKPEQFLHINEFAQSVTQREADQDGLTVLSFGGIHPDSANYKEELRIIRRKGLKGIKLHPYDQRTYVNDIKYEHIIDYASQLGLIILIHCGLDPRFPEDDFGSTERTARMVRDVAPEKLVLAHMGGYSSANLAEELLIGGNFYLDLSSSMRFFPREQFIRMVRDHGSHRILFGSDSPWSGQKTDLTYLRNLGFSAEELEQILWKNGADLLGLLQNNK